MQTLHLIPVSPAGLPARLPSCLPTCPPACPARPPACRDESGGRYVLKRTLVESSKLQRRVRELHADAAAAALSRAAAFAFTQTAKAQLQAPIVSYLTGKKPV